MAALSWEEICERADKCNKVAIGIIKNKNTEKRFLVRCKICNYESQLYIRSFKNCKGCMIISYRKSFFNFENAAKLVHGNKYSYNSNTYISSSLKTEIYCNNCQYYFYQTPHNHLRGHGCPKCNESKGEIRVANYLRKNDIIFDSQKKFKDLKDKRNLKFDFYLSDLNLLIEYDGEFHYKPKRGSNPEEKQKNLEDCQRRDKIKNEWSLRNNIPLLRIPYWDFDKIETLIEAFILRYDKREIKQLALEF